MLTHSILGLAFPGPFIYSYSVSTTHSLPPPSRTDMAKARYKKQNQHRYSNRAARQDDIVLSIDPAFRDMPVHLNVLSLGLGVQSTVMLLMAEHGLIHPRPDLAVFADTQSETARIYEHLEWLRSVTSIPVYTTAASNLALDLVNGRDSHGNHTQPVPFFLFKAGLSSEQDCQNKHRYKFIGQGKRMCSVQYKAVPVRQFIRSILPTPPLKHIQDYSVHQWMGISTDEERRAHKTPYRAPWLGNRYPLLELGMSRQDCIDWFRKTYPGQNLVRSSCIVCPYRSKHEWQQLRYDGGPDWEKAVFVDNMMRDKYYAWGAEYNKEISAKYGDIVARNVDIIEGLDNRSEPFVVPSLKFKPEHGPKIELYLNSRLVRLEDIVVPADFVSLEHAADPESEILDKCSALCS